MPCCCTSTTPAEPVVPDLPESKGRALLETILGDGPASIYSALSEILLSDPALPPISALVSAAPLFGSSALRPSPPLNRALTSLVAILVAPRTAAEEDAALALLDPDAGEPTFAKRALAIRCIAAAAERELELTTASRASTADASVGGNDVCSFMSHFFPYCRNYELLCSAEVSMLVAELQKTQKLTGASCEQPPCGALKGHVLCFVGSGPLPLSGILLLCLAGSKVVLVDVDCEAVETSRQLIRQLESRGLVQKGMLTVECADARCVSFHRKHHDSLAPDVEHLVSVKPGKKVLIRCNAVLLASLLPQPVKAEVAASMAKNHIAPELLLVRSAVGLVAKMAYERVDCRSLEQDGLEYVGEWLPHRGVKPLAPKSLASEDAPQGLSENRNVLGYIHSEVLNSVEVYRSQQ